MGVTRGLALLKQYLISSSCQSHKVGTIPHPAGEESEGTYSVLLR